jgi:hypothetical protein
LGDPGCYWGWPRCVSVHHYLLATFSKEDLNPIQHVPPHAMMMEFHGESVMGNLVEDLAKIYCNGINLLFLIESFCQFVDGHVITGFYRNDVS